MAATFYLALAACTQSGVGNTATVWSAAKATPGVSMRVVRTETKVVDGVEKRNFKLDVQGLPPDKTYDLLMLDFGMHRSGLPPMNMTAATQDAKTGFTATADGRLNRRDQFEYYRFGRREWVEFRIVSRDGTVRSRVVRFLPFGPGT